MPGVGETANARWRNRKGPEAMQEFDRKHRLNDKFGWSLEHYDSAWKEQNGLCAACGEPLSAFEANGKRPPIDHDRRCCPTDITCGKCVRGIVHALCNRAMGLAGENPDKLRKLAQYIERFNV